MPTVLTETDKDFNTSMRKLEIIEKIQPNLLKPKEGAVIVMCGDGDHSDDKFKYFSDLLSQCGSQRRPHLLAKNGGAIWLAKSDILEKIPFSNFDEILIWEIISSLKLKKMNHVFLCVHGPCGMARDILNLSMYDVVKLTFEGKERLLRRLSQEGLSEVKVRCFLHIYDKSDARQRETRFLNRQKWGDNKIHLVQYDDTLDAQTAMA